MSGNLPHVLLTGGAGFIGSHVAEALLRQKEELTVIDNLDDFYSRGQKIKNLAEVRCLGEYDFWNCDIREADELGRAIERARPDAIIHLAARAGVRVSIDQPELYERINVDGTEIFSNSLATSKSRGFSSDLRAQSMEQQLAYHFARMTWT